jgi:hypothetical protein
MFKVTMQPMFAGHEPSFYHFESADLLADFLVIYSSTHCKVERCEP